MSRPRYGDPLLDSMYDRGFDKTPEHTIEADLVLMPGGMAAWLRGNPEAALAYRTGKDHRDKADTLEVEESMLKAANGYTVEKQVMSKAGGVVDLTEEIPPNPTMALKWAERRDKDRWGEKAAIPPAMMAVERLTVINNYLDGALPPPSPFTLPAATAAPTPSTPSTQDAEFRDA